MDTGIFKITIDEKGRFQVPLKIRDEFDSNSLILTYGVENCLQIISEEVFDSIKNTITKSTASMFDRNSRMLLRRFVAPATRVCLDKTGRLSLPRALREDVNLNYKSEGILLNAGPFIEIWSLGDYQAINKSVDMEEASADLFNKMNL